MYDIKTAADTAWGETTIIYSNRPAPGDVVSTFTPSSVGQIIERDITSVAAIKLGQLMSLAIDSSSSNGYDFYSKENLTDKVVLILDFQ